MLIFDESGQVLSANRRADNLLGVRLSRVSVESLFNVSLLELLNQPEGLPFALQTSRAQPLPVSVETAEAGADSAAAFSDC